MCHRDLFAVQATMPRMQIRKKKCGESALQPHQTAQTASTRLNLLNKPRNKHPNKPNSTKRTKYTEIHQILRNARLCPNY